MMDSDDASLEKAIERLPRREPPPGWERRVWVAIDRKPPRTRWRWPVIPVAAIAVTVVLVNLAHEHLPAERPIADGPRELISAAADNRIRSSEVDTARLLIVEARGLAAMDREAAEGLLEQASRIAAVADELVLVEEASTDLGDLMLAERRLDEAERHLDAALAAWHRRGVEAPPVRALLIKARLEIIRADLPAAAAALDRAAPGAPPETESEIAHGRGRIAEAAGDLEEAERWYRQAIALDESIRSRSGEPDAGGEARVDEGWTPHASLFELQLRRRDARGAFATAVQAQAHVLADLLARRPAGEGDPVLRRAGGYEVVEERRGSQIVRRDVLKTRPPSFMGASTRTADDVMAALRERHVLLYFAGNGRMHLLAIVEGRPRITSVDIALARLEALVAEFAARPDDDQLSVGLAAALLPPGTLPSHPGRIDIVPAGPLMQLPFAALRVSAADRLIDRHDVAYVPSATHLATLALGRRSVHGMGMIVAEARTDVAGVSKELRAVMAETGVEARVGARSTGWVLRVAGAAPFLHLIAPERDDGRLTQSDGPVTAVDIVAWRVRPRLVVMTRSGPATTMGREMWDELAAAFLAAGSEHVVTSLGEIDDSVAAEFARLFYRHGGLRDPVAAVNRVQREMVGLYPVATWSAFIATGS